MFCDTSTLAKYYVQEAESAAVRAALDTAERVAPLRATAGGPPVKFTSPWRASGR